MNTIQSRGRFGALLLATLWVAAFEVRAEAPLPPAQGTADAYRLQPGDVLEISVWKEDSLRREVLVRSDGGLSFPLAGDLSVSGLTPDDVRHELEARLGKFIPDVTVSVAVQQINGNQVFVVGRVNRPGVFKFDRPVDVMQALSLAGGATEFAGVDAIRVLRRGADGRQHTFDFAYSDVARGRHLEQNILLKSGDTVVVP
jgi:polysaccharide export outer membrane protein